MRARGLGRPNEHIGSHFSLLGLFFLCPGRLLRRPPHLSHSCLFTLHIHPSIRSELDPPTVIKYRTPAARKRNQHNSYIKPIASG